MNATPSPKPLMQVCEAFLPIEDTEWRLDCCKPPRHDGDHEAITGELWQVRTLGAEQ